MSDPTQFSNVPSSSPEDTLICKPTQWFLWRVLAMLAMFTIFTILFMKDGLWGYREKNLHYLVHKTFVEAGTTFQEMQGGGLNAEPDWKLFAGKKECQFPDNAADVLPKEMELKMPWPAILVEGYATMKEQGGQNGANDLWKQYTSEKGWDAVPEEEFLPAKKIQQQFVAAGVAGALILVALFILIRTMRRTIKADHQALYTQDGRTIAYSDMVRIDKRKWDTKGLAFVYYNEGGEEKKAKIDGMVYGQFKEEEGAPAEKLFTRVMSHFKGEVLEYIEEDEEDEEDEEEADEDESAKADEFSA